MVRHLQELARGNAPSLKNLLLHLMFDVAGKQKAGIAIVEAQHDRIIIGRLFRGTRVGGPEELTMHASPLEGISPQAVHHANTRRARLRDEIFIRRNFDITAHPQFLDGEIPDDGIKSTQMIVMRVREHDGVEPFHAPPP